MRRSTGARPSPALLVAIVALVAALTGTAIGGVAVTALNKGEKKQVKRIAKKQGKKQAKRQIKRKAPGLNVNSAVTAGDADKLDGKHASDIETSSAATDGLVADVQLDGTDTTVASKNIVVRGTQRVIALATIELDGETADPNESGRCMVRIGGTESPGYLQSIPEGGARRANVAITFTRVVNEGAYSVAARCRQVSGTVEVEEANLSVWTAGA